MCDKKMKKILTLSLNPSLDRTLIKKYLSVGYSNTAVGESSFDPAGTGINIARALHQMDCTVGAVVLLGKDATGKAYSAIASDFDFEVVSVTVPGKTRSNTIIFDPSNNTETNITELAGMRKEKDIDLVLRALVGLITPGDYVVFAGDAPEAVPPGTYARLVAFAKNQHAHVCVVGGGMLFEESLVQKPEIVAVTQIQLEGIFSVPLRDQNDLVEHARKLLSEGVGEVLILVPEENEVYFINKNRAMQVAFPAEEQEGTATGVWDTLIAGFLAGKVKKLDIEESLGLGAAAASLAAAEIGYDFPELERIEELTEDVLGESLDEDHPDE